MDPSGLRDAAQLLLDSLPTVTVVTVDEHLRVREARRARSHRSGPAPSDLVGRPLSALTGETLAQLCAPAVRSALAGSPGSLRVQNPAPAGDPRPGWIELVVTPTTSPDGRPEAFCTLRDVTDEHHRDFALSEAEQRLRLLDEGAHEYAVFALSPAGEVQTWNDGAERITGYPAAEAVGRPLALLSPTTARAAGWPEVALRRALEHGTFRDEVWQVRRDGSRIWCRVSVKALTAAHGALLGYACILRDLSDHRRSQAALAAREEMYRAAFDDAPSGMALVERSPGGWWRIREANAALATLSGYPVVELVSGSVSLLGDHGDGRLREVFDHQARRFEVALVRADGSRRATVVGMSPLTVSGQEAGTERYVVQFHDVTARREAERAAAEALARERRVGDELRELERLRSDFLATVSHELRTPLSSVLGYAELFDDGDLGELTPAQRSALAGITRNANRLRDLVGDLLVMSSIQRGSLRAARIPTELDAVVKNACEQIGPELTARRHVLTVAGDTGVQVDVDGALLERVLLGLLGNAVKFTPAGGAISLVVATSAAGGKREVTIAVGDDGIGIDPRDVPHLFEPFYRTARSQKLAVGGTGLGLSLVKRVVEIHDGTIDVVSEPGVRTEFTVRLPLPSSAGER